MAQTIDERIVEMRIDNEQFELGAAKSIETLGRLREASEFGGLEGSTRTLQSFGQAISGFSDSTTKAVTEFADKIPILGTVVETTLSKIKEWSAKRIIENFIDSAFDSVTKLTKAFTLDPITTGFEKFGEKTTAVATLAAQGYELEKVNALMEQLNWFTDETSFNFTDMVKNISKFTATGQDLDKSVTAMEGIALWAALSGQNATTASRAMYQLSQAMGKGALKYDDYKSIQNASMDTMEFRQQAVAAAEALGTLKKVGEDTWQTLGSNAKAEKALADAEKKLASAQADLDYAISKRSQAKTETQIQSIERSISKATEKVEEYKQKVLEAQAALSNGFSLSDLFSSKALSENQWFTSDVMMEVFNQYSKAATALQQYIDDHEGIDTATDAIEALRAEAQGLADDLGITLDEAFQQLGYDIDEFALKAFEAGQQARTWEDVVASVKDAVSTGWMTTFETIIGTAEEAAKFWTDIANKFYEIFAEGGNLRNEILKVGFGTGINPEQNQQTVDGWERFTKRIEAAGKTMDDFETSCRKVIDATGDMAVDDLIKQYGGLKEAFQQGAISGELFKAILNDLTGATEGTAQVITETIEEAKYSLDELQEVAKAVLRGDYGDGAARRQLLEEMGYNADLVQALAEIIYNGGQGYVGITEELLKSEYPTFYAMLSETMTRTVETVQEFNDAAIDSDAILEDIQTNIVEITGDIEQDIKAVKGTTYFKDAILNIIDSFQLFQEAGRAASEAVFGDYQVRGARVYKLLENFYNATDRLKTKSEEASTVYGQHIKNVYEILVEAFKLAKETTSLLGTILSSARQAAGSLLRGIFGDTYDQIINGTSGIKDTVISAIKAIQGYVNTLNSKIQNYVPDIKRIANSIGTTLRPVFEGLYNVGKALLPVLGEIVKLLASIGGFMIKGVGNVIQGFLGKLSADDVTNVSKSISETLVDSLETARTKISSFADAIKTKMPDVQLTLQNIGAAIRTVFEGIIDAFPLLLQAIGAGINNALNLLVSFVPSLQPFADNVSSWLASMFGVPSETGEKYLPEFKKIFGDLETLVSETFDKLAKTFGFENLSAIRDELDERFGGLWTTLTGWYENIKKFFSDFGIDISFESSDTVFGKISKLLSGFTSAGAANISTVSGEGLKFDITKLFPEDSEISTKFENFWNNVQRIFSNTFGKVDWTQAFDIGKLAVFGYFLFNVNKFFNNLKITVDPKRNGIFGILESVKQTITNFGKPFTAWSNAIKQEAESNAWIKLATSIGILAGSILLLSTIPEQTFFNVSAVLMGLMLLLKWIAASGNGLQIFSNNVKQVQKDVTSTAEFFKNLDFKDLKLKALFENITLTGNVIPPAMGALIGIAAAIAVIGEIVIRLRDLKDIHEILPALTAVGAMLGGIVLALIPISAMGPRLKGVGPSLLMLGLTVGIISKIITSLGNSSITWEGFGTICAALLGVFVAFMSLSTALENIDKAGISGKKLLAFAAVISSFGIAFGILSLALRVLATADTSNMFVAGVSLGIVGLALAAIVSAFAKFPEDGPVMKAAFSLGIMAAALSLMTIPLMKIANSGDLMNTGIAAAIMLGLAVSLRVLVGALSDFPEGESTLKGAAAIALLAVGLGAMIMPVTMLAAVIEPLGWNLALAAAGLLVFGIGLTTIFAALEKWTDSDTILINAAAMVALSAAIGILSLAIGHLAGMDWQGVVIAAATLLVLGGAMTAALAVLSKMDSNTLLAAGSAMIMGAAAIGILTAALAGLAIGIGALVQNVDWDQFGEKASAMHKAIEPIAPEIAVLLAVLVGITVVCAMAGDSLFKAGLGFAGVGVGVLAVMAAMTMFPQALEGIVKGIDYAKEHAGTLIGFAAVVVAGILAVVIASKMHFGEAIVGIVTSCAQALAGAETLAKFGAALKTIGAWLLSFLIMAMPGLVDKLLALIVSLIDSLAEAINKQANNIVTACEKLIVSLLSVMAQAILKFTADAAAFISSLIEKVIEDIGLDPSKGLGKILKTLFDSKGYAEAGDNLADAVQGWADNVMDKLDERVTDGAKEVVEDASAAATTALSETEGNIASAAAEAVGTARDTAVSEIDASSADVASAVSTVAETAVAAAEDTITANTPEAEATAAESAESVIGSYGESALNSLSTLTESIGLSLDDLTSIFGTKGVDNILEDFSTSLPQFSAAGESGGTELGGGVETGVANWSEAGMDNILASLTAAANGDHVDWTNLGGMIGEFTGDGYEKYMDKSAPDLSGSTVEDLSTAITADSSKYEEGGKDVATSVSDGYQTEMARKVIAMSQNTVDGLIQELRSHLGELYNMGQESFAAYEQGYNDAGGIASPSKEMAKEMGYTIEGLVVGAKKYGKRAYNAMYQIGDGMLDTMHNSMAMLALAVDRNYDIEPRITPVVDLTQAERGIDQLQTMMVGGELRAAMAGYSGLDSLSITGATLNYTNQNGPVASALHDLSSQMSGLGKSLDEDRNFNVDITISNMAVRDESDVRAISKQLANEIRVALRQKGVR